jgi:hypothetical protein
MINLLGSLFHFFLHLALVGFHWIVGLSAIYALVLIVKEPKNGLVTTIFFSFLFCITPSGLAASTPPNQNFSELTGSVQGAYQVAASNCDPSYPDFCIAPPLPDLNCKDIKRKNFTVLQPDPHKFDRDKDGIGCES